MQLEFLEVRLSRTRLRALADWRIDSLGHWPDLSDDFLLSEDPDLKIWRDPSGPDRFSLQFGTSVIFAVDCRRRWIAAATRGQVDRDLVLHHLGNQMMPRVLGHLGALVLHSAAISEGEGNVILFVGPSGSGKSTLAASFYGAGFRLLGDDAIKVVRRDDEVVAEAVYRSLRLFPDSLDAVLAKGADWRPVVAGASKLQALRFDQEPEGNALPIKAIFFVDPAQATDIQIQPVSAADACVALVEECFWIDPGDVGQLQDRIARAAAVAEAVPCARLRYPRNYAALPAVRSQVLESLQ